MYNSDGRQKMGRVNDQIEASSKMSDFLNQASMCEFQRKLKFRTEDKNWRYKHKSWFWGPMYVSNGQTLSKNSLIKTKENSTCNTLLSYPDLKKWFDIHTNSRNLPLKWFDINTNAKNLKLGVVMGQKSDQLHPTALKYLF